MAQRTEVDWTTCEQVGCIGKRLAEKRTCLAHANSEERATALLLVGQTGAIDVRGVPMTSELLKQVLHACPRGSDGNALVRDSQFDRATFTGDAFFGHATFTSGALFGLATFTHDAFFRQATFTGDAYLGRW